MRIFVCSESSGVARRVVGGTHGLEIAVYDIHRMQILKSARCLCKLQEYFRI